MKKAICIAAVLGMVMMSCSMKAQAPAATPVAATANADQPTKEQLNKLFAVMRVRQQMDSVLKMMPQLVQQQMQAQAKDLAAQFPGKAMSPQQQEEMNKVMGRYMEKAINIYPVEEMLEDMATIYQRHLSRTDVDAFIAFYESPAGRHLLEAQPAIMQEYMPMVMKRVGERSKVLTEELAKDIKEQIKAAGGNVPEKK